jgi:hypothetical protein
MKAPDVNVVIFYLALPTNMHGIYFLLSLCVYKICEASSQSVTGVIPRLQLLPDDFSALGDYEVMSVHQEADEDIVRIRKRVDEEDCGSDCLNYSGWTESRRMECKDETPTSQDELDEESGLRKRAISGKGTSRKGPTLYVGIRV